MKVTSLAIKAFYAALPFASNNFKVSDERDYIMRQVFEGFSSPDEDI